MGKHAERREKVERFIFNRERKGVTDYVAEM